MGEGLKQEDQLMPVLLVQLGKNGGLEQQEHRCIEGERFKVYLGQRADLQLAA